MASGEKSDSVRDQIRRRPRWKFELSRTNDDERWSHKPTEIKFFGEREILTVNELSRVVNERLDETFSLQVLDRDPGKRTVDLHSVDEDGLGDELEGGDFLEDSVVDDLVADDGVVGLVLYLSCVRQSGSTTILPNSIERVGLPLDHFFFFPALP